LQIVDIIHLLRKAAMFQNQLLLNNFLRLYKTQFDLRYWLFMFIFLCVTPSLADEKVLVELDNLQALQADMQADKKPLMLVFRASYCRYCRQLEKEQLLPLLQDTTVRDRIIIRTVTLDAEHSLRDWQGTELSPKQLGKQYQVSITPTLVFVNSQGKELVEAIKGYNGSEFFGAYLENAIAQAQQAIKQP
jgi:thioredoxin-related protein